MAKAKKIKRKAKIDWSNRAAKSAYLREYNRKRREADPEGQFKRDKRTRDLAKQRHLDRVREKLEAKGLGRYFDKYAQIVKEGEDRITGHTSLTSFTRQLRKELRGTKL